MSANDTNTCPACYHRATGTPFAEITQVDHLNEADEAGIEDDALHEYYEVYLDKGQLVFAFHGAECKCGYSIPEFTLKRPIPPLEER